MVKQPECRNAKIFMRVLPQTKMCWEHVKILEDKKTVYVRCLQDLRRGGDVSEPNYWIFDTDGVFYNDPQYDIYGTVTSQLLDHITTKCQNAIILSYGQTGTGKSLTISGTEASYEDRGIIPRLIQDLFHMKNETKKKYKLCIKVSYIEAAKSYIRDLLSNEEALYDIHNIKNVTTMKCSTEEHILKTIFKAEGRKTLAKNSIYASHAATSVLTITIVAKQPTDCALNKIYSKIHIVDLAGMDAAGNETCIQKTNYEVSTANLAKSQLETFLLILLENVPEHIAIAHRSNILLHYIKDCLNANSLLRCVGHIRTDKEYLQLTLSMLRFGQIIRGLKSRKSESNTFQDDEAKIVSLKSELTNLKTMKKIDSMINNDNLGLNLTQDRITHMRSVAEDYLKNKINELSLVSVTDINIVLQIFKNMFTQLESEKSEAMEQAYKRAYDDVSSTLKLKQGSMPLKGFKRSSSFKSKDSLPPSSRSSTKNSKKSLTKHTQSKAGDELANEKFAPSRLKYMAAKSKSRESLDKSMKASRTSSKIFRKSAINRRKSSGSDTQREKDIQEDTLLPDGLPNHDEAWASFINSESYSYNELKIEMDEYERDAKERHICYLNEIKELQELRNKLDCVKEQFRKAEMQRQLENGNQINAEGDPILSEQETIIQKMIQNCEKEIVEEQEKIMAIQAELQLFLQLYRDKKKDITENFQLYCNTKYKTAVPSFESLINETELNILNPKSTAEELTKQEEVERAQEEIAAQKRQDLFTQFEGLKSLMYRQREKMVHNRLLNKKWIQSCKKY